VQAAQDFPQSGVLGALVAEDLSGKNSVGGQGIIDFTHGKTKVKQPQTESPVECEWMQGSNFLLRTEALKQVGLFDERYFLYFEDTDLCYRMTQKEWKCMLVPTALIAHIGNASTQDKRRHWRSYYYIRNRFLFFNTYLSGANKVGPQLFMLAHLARHALALPFRGENGRCQLRAEMLGARDYYAGNFGKAKCLDWCEPS
jgi:GT2 family glycosyltransferase